MLQEFAIIVIRGLGVGAIYSLLAISFNVVHRSSGVVNFAQGSFLIVGGFAAALLFGSAVPALTEWLLLLPLVTLMSGILLLLLGWLVLAPLRDATQQQSWMISTMAISVVIGSVILLTQGPFAKSVQSPFSSVNIFGTRTPSAYIMSVCLMIAWYLVFRAFYSWTRTGTAMSAVAQDIDAARAAGLRVKRLQLLSFLLSGLVVGSAGYIASPVISISSDSGIRYMLNGFIAAVVGGMGSNLGAVIAGPLLGIITMATAFFLGGEYQNLVSLLVLVSVLMVRPEGIFGRPDGRRV